MDIKKFDRGFITFANKWFDPLARIALFVIFAYFGALKLLSLSPAESLATELIDKTVGAQYFDQLFLVLAIFEVVIGILFLIPKYTRIVILLLCVHMIIACSPLLITPELTWDRFLVPSLEGQYIIKNIALLILALGLVAKTKPISK
ncbi:MAG: DoxX family membrane protein [Patescibacteria group bacterium]